MPTNQQVFVAVDYWEVVGTVLGLAGWAGYSRMVVVPIVIDRRVVAHTVAVLIAREVTDS